MEPRHPVYFTLVFTLADRYESITDSVEKYARELIGSDDFSFSFLEAKATGSDVFNSAMEAKTSVLEAYGKTTKEGFERFFNTSLDYTIDGWVAQNEIHIPIQYHGKLLFAQLRSPTRAEAERHTSYEAYRSQRFSEDPDAKK